MTPLFHVNFRREVYQRERERVHRRVVALGLWVGYFGVLALVIGLYGLNCSVLHRRERLAEARLTRMRASHMLPERLTLGAAELAQVEHAVRNPRIWHERMARLAALLPPDAALQSVTVNPDNLSSEADQNRLLIEGSMRSSSGQDRMPGVMQLVAALHADSAFAAGYQSIKLVKSNMSMGETPTTNFTIECR